MDVKNWKILDVVIVFGISVATTFLLWLGCNFWFAWVRKHYPWEKSPPRHLLITIFPLLTLVSVFFALAVVIVDLSLSSIQISVSSVYRSSIVTIIFTMVFASIYEGRYIYRKWKISELRVSLLKQEVLNTELNYIKRQIDPHFLFNSLSVLTRLIEKNKVLATQFVQELAKMYRYVLEHNEEQILSLEKEIECLDAYVFLLKQRYPQGFEFKNTISKADYNQWIPPLTLQILMENAVKHNEFNSKKPLQISLSFNKKQIIFKNDFRPKGRSISSTKIGLKTLIKRYQLLIEEEPLILNNKKYFTIYLPVINQKKLS